MATSLLWSVETSPDRGLRICFLPGYSGKKREKSVYSPYCYINCGLVNALELDGLSPPKSLPRSVCVAEEYKFLATY